MHAVNYNNSTGDLLYDDGAGSTLPYRLFLPQGYDPNVKYPIVVFYHGAGQRGSNNLIAGGHAENVYQATQGNFGAQFKAFHLVPQCPTDQRWVEFNWAAVSYTDAQEPAPGQAMTASLAILDQVIATYPVDPNRIYVTGLSMGGIATWDVIRHRPNRIAAAMPLSGGGNKDQGALLSSVPIWAYHGAADGVVPTRGTDQMRDAIVAAGGSIEYTRPAGISHSGWSTFYNNTTYLNSANQSTYTWLFAQQNNDPSTLVSRPSSTPADGSSTATLCVSLRDSSNTPLVGKTVTLSSSRAD
ncbi:dienelactone hydrolase family protein [Akkermansiaceae bacterium]|nr:dienelactone hydrolase family protein [Akkermansiaceae bacterium]